MCVVLSVSPAAPSHTVCYQGTFYCAPLKQCYPNDWKCDGTLDCPDGSDEPNTCPTTAPVTGQGQCSQSMHLSKLEHLICFV